MQEISIRNLHSRSKLELPGVAWKQGARPLRICEREKKFVLSGRKAEKKNLLFSGWKAEKNLFFWPKGGKGNFVLAERQKRKFVLSGRA